MKISNENINKLPIDCVEPVQLKNLEELQARYDARQSFYKKAHTGEFLNCLYLKSYDTIVACIFQNQLRIYGAFSQTTARHIREFARQNGFDDVITYNDMKNQCVFSK